MVSVNKKDSIYFQLLKLLTFSAIIAVTFFVLMNRNSDDFIARYYEESDYAEKRDERYVDKFQAFIDANEISSKDTAKLKAWVKEQKVITLRVYVDDKKIFDSEYPDQNLWDEDIESDEYDWETYYTIEFSDRNARIGIVGWYEYQLYYCAFVVELVVSFMLFAVIVLLGIRKKMKYISKLSDEIAILEGGSLDYKITIKGKDELAALAEGLENMRISFCNMIEQEAEITSENNRIITEMSHDLRTPVTSMMLYTEILKKGRYKNEQQLLECLDKIDRKAHRMKQLTDHLFEYALISGEKEIELEKPESIEILFYDLLSETCSYLNQKGFEVDVDVDWSDRKVSVYTEYIVRILDNISSNIVKYADSRYKIVISSVNTENMFGFRFENREVSLEEKTDSSGVGLQSIKNMMKKMNGKCRITHENDIFAVELYFPYIS